MKLRVGIVNVGPAWETRHLPALRSLTDRIEVRTVCDPVQHRARIVAKQLGASVGDSFQLVARRSDIDALLLLSGHWYGALPIFAACDAGKAVYCEKPLTHTIPEAIAVMEKQAETKLPVQVGVQGMSDDSYISAREAIQGDVIGQVVQAQIEYVRRYGEQGLFRNPSINDDTPKPADLDWNAWLGPAAKTEWNPHHYYEWRNYSMYSGGIATDLFIHRITRIMKALDLFYPRRVVGMGGIWQWPEHRDLPDNFEMICEYPRGMTVYVLGTMSNRVGIDHLIRGYRGTLYFTKEGWVAKDHSGEKILGEHKKTGAEDTHLHHTNLHNHMRNGEELNCPVKLGVAGVTAVVMANESWRTGQMMGWDEEKRQMVPCHTLIHNPYPAETTELAKQGA